MRDAPDRAATVRPFPLGLGAAGFALLAWWLMFRALDQVGDSYRVPFLDKVGDGARALPGLATVHEQAAGIGLGLVATAAVLTFTGRSGRLAPMWLVRRALRRKPLDDLLDWLRFRIDTFPRRLRLLTFLGLPQLDSAGAYQDLPWVGLRTGRRRESTNTRWAEIEPVVRELDTRSAVDIGSNYGWFVFALGGLGIPTIGMEREARSLRVSRYALKKAPLALPVGFLDGDVNPDSIELVPPADCILVLSIWHHFVRDYGLAETTRMMKGVWAKTGKVLFFETGESEMENFGLPAMEPDARTWLGKYLSDTCSGSRVVHLGYHDAGLEPIRGTSFDRNLFAVVREEGADSR